MVVAALLALAASVAYGSSDLVAGLAARRARPIAIAFWGHLAGTLVVGTLAWSVAGAPPLGGLVFGLVGGAVAAVGLVLFYGALARGSVSIVAPLAAAGAVVPVSVGVARGEVPGALGWVGLAIAVLGVVVLATALGPQTAEPNPPCAGARPGCPDEGAARSPRIPPTLAALLAAGAFGSAFVLIDLGGSGGTAPLWVAAGLQTGGFLGLLPIALAGPLTRLAVPRAALPVLLVSGLLAAAGDVALAIAFTQGDIAVVSVLASLDSAVSVLLARMILREKLSLRQAAAVLAVLTGAVLLAAT
ncbi:EamA family transporter [Pseudonocardia sp. DLS-67]